MKAEKFLPIELLNKIRLLKILHKIYDIFVIKYKLDNF